jgi:hypothetical protein
MVKVEGSSAVDAANMPVEQPSSSSRHVAAFWLTATFVAAYRYACSARRPRKCAASHQPHAHPPHAAHPCVV